MTEQYNQINVNNNGTVVAFASDVPAANLDLPPSSQLVVVDAGAAITVTLPSVSTVGNNATITVFKASGGGANTVGVLAAAGDNIAGGAAANPIVAVGGSLTLKSIAPVGWRIVGDTV